MMSPTGATNVPKNGEAAHTLRPSYALMINITSLLQELETNVNWGGFIIIMQLFYKTTGLSTTTMKVK